MRGSENLLKTTVSTTLLSSATLAAGLCVCVTSHAQSTPQQKPEEIETLYISDQYSYDDNLFRLSESADLSDPLNAGIVSRDDYVNRLTAGIGEDIEIGRQVFTVQARAQDVRFSENDHLDHVAGNGKLGWDWLMTSALSGTLGARYTRSLADFANSRGALKDILETMSYEGSLRYKLGPRWSVFAGGEHTKTEHGLDLRRADDFEADTGRAGIQYTTPTQHTFALEYRVIDGQFPNRLLDPASSLQSGDYEENAALARIGYTLSVHTHLQAMYGYVERTHDDDPNDEFSGDIWRAEISWQPRPKFSTKVAAWRELRAYVDAESDYFISDGISVTPSWSPLRQLSLSFALAWEEQEYLGFDPIDPTTVGRVDDVFSGLGTFAYSPTDNLSFELSYRAFDRSSNRDIRRYDAEVAGLSFRWRVL